MKLLLSVLVVLVAGLAGCGSPYVNIPAQPGDLATHDPDGRAVRDAVVPAVRAVLEREMQAGDEVDEAGEIRGPVRIEMPREEGGGAEAVASATVARLVGGPAVGEHEVTRADAASTLEVSGIRIRGTSAEVDVRRREGDFARLHTVYMKRNPIGGDWKVERVRAWRGGDPTLPEGSFQPQINANERE